MGQSPELAIVWVGRVSGFSPGLYRSPVGSLLPWVECFHCESPGPNERPWPMAIAPSPLAGYLCWVYPVMAGGGDLLGMVSGRTVIAFAD